MPSQGTGASQPHTVRWEWLFNALWAGCRRSILRLQLPETVLFTDGQPQRWLGSTGGHVQRRDFLEHAKNAMRRRGHSHQMHDRLRSEFSLREQLSLIHAQFVEFRQARLGESRSGGADDDDDGTITSGSNNTLGAAATAARGAAARDAEQLEADRAEQPFALAWYSTKRK